MEVGTGRAGGVEPANRHGGRHAKRHKGVSTDFDAYFDGPFTVQIAELAAKRSETEWKFAELRHLHCFLPVTPYLCTSLLE